jgi:hypothetical protein
VTRLPTSFVACSLAACSLAATVPRACAKTGFAESLEWVVVDSDRVVRGAISSVAAVPQRAPAGDSPWCLVNVKVAETLKGPADEEVAFLVWTGTERGYHALAERKGQELLLFLVSTERYYGEVPVPVACPWTLRAGPNQGWSHAIVDLTNGDSLSFVTADCQKLSDWKAIRRAARAACKVPCDGRVVEQFQVGAPNSTQAFWQLWPGSSVILAVPDIRREEVAKAWLASKSDGLRVRGARALRHFRSEENLRLLQGLLSDPQRSAGYRRAERTFPLNLVLSASDEIPVWRYPVREGAYATLTEWGVSLPEPVIEESVAGAIVWRALSAVGLIGAVVVLGVLLRQVRSRHRRPAGVAQKLANPDRVSLQESD